MAHGDNTYCVYCVTTFALLALAAMAIPLNSVTTSLPMHASWRGEQYTGWGSVYTKASKISLKISVQ